VSRVRIGRIGRTHGVAGEILLDTLTFTPAELNAMRSYTWIGRDGAERPLVLRSARAAHDRMIVAFDGVTTREAAALLTLGELWAEASKLPDPGPGLAYRYQLTGCTVMDEQGGTIGVLEDILDTAAHPIYRVRTPEGREVLIPAVDAFLRSVDVEGRRIVVALPEGLLDV
jgi:16S rRNA processing protein RimM